MQKLRISTGMAAMVAPFVGGPLAWGQAALSTDQSAQAPVLQEVVVTAQKRSENLQNVPISVTALSGGALQRSGVISTADLGVVTPGLTLGSVIGNIQPNIRGIGTTQFGGGTDNDVATYLDGVYLASGFAQLMTLNAVSQVAVLKGPQGTLFGRNATGGVIQVTTEDPLQTFGGQADIGYGNFQTGEADLYVTGPITSTLAANLSVQDTVQGQGYGRNLFNGEDVYKTDHDVAALSKWMWTPGDTTTVVFEGDYEETSGNGVITSKPSPGTAQLYSTLAASPLGALLKLSPELPLGTYDIDSAVQPDNSFKGGGASIHVRQDLGFANLQSITAWRRNRIIERLDESSSPNPLITLATKATDSQYSEEVNLTSKTPGRLHWVAGLFYLNTSSQPDPVGTIFGPVFRAVTKIPFSQNLIYGEERTNSYAAYGQTTYDLSDTDHLTFGARYTQETRILVNNGTTHYLLSGLALPPTLYNDRFTAKRPSWRVAYDHNFTADVMGYVSYSTGFKSGGFDLVAPGTSYKPEALYATETGVKLDLLDHRLRVNTAAFYYDYKNIQVQYATATGNVALYNGAAAKLYGLDSDLQALLAPGFSVTAGVALLKDYFTDFPTAIVYFFSPGSPPSRGPPPSPGRPPTFTATVSAVGHPLPEAPSATYNLGADYAHALLGGQGDLNVVFKHSDGYTFSPGPVPNQAPYNALNASLSWSSADEGFRVTLWGRNLTNDAVAVGDVISPLGPLVNYGPPRTYGITLGTKF